jgi:hypothetical protein
MIDPSDPNLATFRLPRGHASPASRGRGVGSCRSLLARAPVAGGSRDRRRPATDWVERMRADTRPGLMEVFLAEYGLSTEEGVALMCLAEALLAGARCRDGRCADRGQDRAVGMGRASGPVLLLAGQRLDLGADADGPGPARRSRAGRRRHAARRRQAAGRAGDPHRRPPRHARDGQPVRPRRGYRRGHGAGADAGGEGIHAIPTTCWGRRR